jgi:manganese-transporting P-type ATPase
MLADFIGCWIVEITCKRLFADVAPKALITRGRERREWRRAEEERLRIEEAARIDVVEAEKKNL